MRDYSDARPLNIGVGDDITIVELARLVARVVGFAGEIVHDTEKPDGTPRKLLDVSRLTALGWRASIPLENGIAEAYRWFVENLGARHGLERRMALVTFGVPVYNGAGQIEECLDCMVNQTLRDIEIVVSDNASRCHGEIVMRYAARDFRIRYIRQPTNIGLMKNFAAVVHAAQSSYFILRCHDDLSSANYAEALYTALQGEHAGQARGSERRDVRSVGGRGQSPAPFRTSVMPANS